MKWLDTLTGGYKSSAKVVNDTLILSLPDASSPVVWRMELGEIKAAAFEVQKKDGGGFELVMKTPAGKTQQIAPFDSRAGALGALMSASRAMEQAQNMAKSAANDKGGYSTASGAPAKKGSGSLLAGVIGVAVLIALIYGLTQMGPRSATSMGFQATGASTENQAAPAAKAGGVPVSADDFLKGR